MFTTLLNLLEDSYFEFPEKKREDIPKEEKYRAFSIKIDVFMETIDVVYGSDQLFNVAFPTSKIHPKYGVTKNDFTGIYNFPILKGKDPVKIIGDVLVGAEKIVREISRDKGIENNETEAYLFGYICSNILPRILDYQKLYNLEKDKAKEYVNVVLKEKYGITFHRKTKYKSKEDKVEFSITGENVYGSCFNVINSPNTHILIRPKKGLGDFTKTSIYTHELYHMYRRLHSRLDRYYDSKEDFIRELVEVSYSFFIYYIGR